MPSMPFAINYAFHAIHSFSHPLYVLVLLPHTLAVCGSFFCITLFSPSCTQPFFSGVIEDALANADINTSRKTSPLLTEL